MTILYQKDWINEEWFTPEYQQIKKENFEKLDKYLNKPPVRILDIGCGLAWESRFFNQKYNSELYLLDGDFDSNPVDKKLMQARYSTDSKEFAFYYKLDFLKKELDKLNTNNYTLVDCNNIHIDKSVKFDLITSWVSCGFHYPINTYRDLILKHSHANTVIVMDLRILTKTVSPVVDENVEIVNEVNKRQKYVTSHIRFNPLPHVSPAPSTT
jgi:SAM-dependent methyltransferase